MKSKSALVSAVVLGLMSGTAVMADHHDGKQAPSEKKEQGCNGKDGCGAMDKSAGKTQDETKKSADKKEEGKAPAKTAH